MILPEDIDKHEFSTTRFKEGYDPNEVDNFLDLVIVDYRAALARLNYLEYQENQRKSAETAVMPAVYSDMDKLLAIAQQHADQTIADASGRAKAMLDQADAQSGAIVQSGQDEKNRLLGELTTKRDEIEAQIAALQAEQAAVAASLTNALAALEQQS